MSALRSNTGTLQSNTVALAPPNLCEDTSRWPTLTFMHALRASALSCVQPWLDGSHRRASRPALCPHQTDDCRAFNQLALFRAAQGEHPLQVSMYACMYV